MIRGKKRIERLRTEEEEYQDARLDRTRMNNALVVTGLSKNAQA
jgi:hypothetical protein